MLYVPVQKEERKKGAGGRIAIKLLRNKLC